MITRPYVAASELNVPSILHATTLLPEKGLSDGCETYRYEKIGVYHSWNANWLFTNSIVFSVQRHSDHHAHAYKPYQVSPLHV